MQLINCPYCGPRAEIEFVYGCAAEKAPGATEGTDREELARIFIRENPKGLHAELWQHVSGCRSWIKVTRNTLTHEIASVEPARKTQP